MTTAKRRIKRGKITHVSLCRRAMNQLPVLMKSGGRVQIDLLTKSAGEGLLHSLVYVPNIVDAEGDVASAEVVKQMAHDFLANGGNIDIEHNLEVLGPDKVRIAETFIVQKGDERFAGWKDYQGRDVDATGSWGLILKVLDPELRAAAERGELNGVSMFGQAEIETLTKTNTNTMTPEQMQALAEMLAKSLQAAMKPPTPAAREPIPFEGDPLNPEDLAKHMDKVLFASLDLSKPSDLAKWQGHVAKRQAEIAKAQVPQQTELEKAQAELKKAQETLAKLQKASGAPVEGEQKPDETPAVGLSKAEKDLFAAGRAIAKKFQGRK